MTNGDDVPLGEQLEALAVEYGNRFLLEPAPRHALPEHGMRSIDAMRLIGEELILDGIPERNLATFVTTWMEPEAQRMIAENLHRNFIDHAEYPQTAEIEQRCIRMLADLFHAPGETTGARTQGSSEAIMLGALSLKWKWRGAARAGRQGHDAPEPRLRRRRARRVGEVLPLLRRRAADHPAAARQVHDRARGRRAARRREHDRRGRRARHHVHGARRRHPRHQRPPGPPSSDEKGLDVPLHVDAASGGFVWPFLYPDSEWDFRLEQVRSINVSGHKFGLVYPGIGWLVFRETRDLAEDLVFYENYLGKRDATFTLNFSTGAAMVLAQYYNFVRLRARRATATSWRRCSRTRARWRSGSSTSATSALVGEPGAEQLPLVAFQLAEERNYDEFDVASQLAAERGWMVPGLHAAARTPSTSRSCARSSS